MLRDLNPSIDADTCASIVATLPEWFGQEQGIADCAAAVRSQRGLVADDGDVIGFVTWNTHDGVAEITWMAVRADARRRGIGRALLDALVERLRAEGITELRVTTLSSRDPYQPYAETRAFYSANGFETIEELDIWGPQNPAVLLARRI